LEIQFINGPIETIHAELIVVGIRKDNEQDLADLDKIFGGHLASWAKENRFTGAPNSSLKFPTNGLLKSNTLLLVGLGKGSDDEVRAAAGHAGRAARTMGTSTMALCLGEHSKQEAQTVAEMALAGNYAFDRFKKESDRRTGLNSLMIMGAGDTQPNGADAVIRAKWQDITRDLVNLPPADLYPETLADAARKLGDLDHVEVEVWDFERCRKEGCVGIIAVGQGSSRPGCLIHIKYNPPGAKGHVSFVGKGVTFDSGGLSLKPSGSMQTMRCDMAGSATVLGAAGAIAELGVPIRVDTFIGAVENMVAANSYKLGDILTYNNGVSVEIHNTDAEGRLVLADCLIQACKLDGVTHVIDAATLTGACVVAVGEDFTGVFTDDTGLYGDLAQCAELESEGVWRLPLHKPYIKHLKSEWADLKNVGSRSAGATTAALFLQHFVEDSVSWAHLDVAGAAFNERTHQFYASGATGQMVRTLTSWAKHQAEHG
jgi:leucyl aminopeptidase